MTLRASFLAIKAKGLTYIAATSKQQKLVNLLGCAEFYCL